MEQVFFAGYYLTLSTFSTRYAPLSHSYTWSSTSAASVSAPVSTDGKIKNLRVKLDGSPGAGKKYVFTLIVNGAPSALTVEIANAATSGADTTHEVDVAAGDTISLECNPDGTPTARDVTFTSVFEGDTAKESLIMQSGTYVLSNADIEYSQVAGGATDNTTIENDFRQVVPTAGTIKNLYVKLTTDPGTAPDAFRFTLRKNGASQTLTVTITADDTTGNDLVNTVDVVAGDILTMMIEPLNTPAQPNCKPSWGMTFVADVDGESIRLGGSSANIDTATTKYNFLHCIHSQWYTATESDRYQLGQSCILKKLYVLLSAAPGAGKSYTFTVRIAGADSNIVVAIADAATTGNSAALEDTVALDDYVNLKVVPASTPDVADAYWGSVCYVAPPPTPVADGDLIGIAIIRKS